MITAVANPASVGPAPVPTTEPLVAMPVAGIYHQVVDLLAFVPGQVVAEVDLYALSKAVAVAEAAVLDQGTVAMYPAACAAIVEHADTIFRKDDWFKSLALALLKAVARTHA